MMGYLRLEIIRVLRNPRYLVLSLGMPLGFYLLFASIYGGNLGGVGIQAYFLASMATYGAMGAALNASGTRLAVERATGWTRQLRVTPLKPTAYLATKVVAALALALPAVVLVVLAGVFVNHVAMSAATMARVVLASWLGCLPFAALGIFIGYVLDSDSAQSGTMIVYLGLALLGGMWVPIEVMPAALRAVAPVLPSYHFERLSLDALAGRGASASHLLVLLAYTLVFGALAIWRFRRDEAKEYA